MTNKTDLEYAQVIYQGPSGPHAVMGERCVLRMSYLPLVEQSNGNVFIGKFSIAENSDGELFECPTSWFRVVEGGK